LWRERDNVDRYLLSGIAIIFIIFSLIKTKLPHYTLPAFGLLALLLARHWPETVAGSRRPFFATVAVTTAAIWIATALVIPPLVARFFPAYQLLQISRASLAPNMQFASVAFEEPSLVWYFRSRVKGFLTPLNRRRATEFMSVSGPRFIILPTSVAGTLFANSPQQWKFVSTSGFNIAKGKRVDLTMVLKPE
jgi:4-amino-4-deoxy-L-arabinose transferase-like glycosyltransferase